MFKVDLEKVEEPEVKLSTSAGSLKKQESARKTSISTLLTYAKALDCVSQLWKILKEVGILDRLTCLLRNLYAGQEGTVRNGHGTIDWFQTGKGVCQGCILSHCLFNLYAEYIMRNAQIKFMGVMDRWCFSSCHIHTLPFPTPSQSIPMIPAYEKMAAVHGRGVS